MLTTPDDEVHDVVVEVHDSEQRGEVQAKARERIVGVFIPTTPNPTSGFLVLVPESQVTKLEMSVADGIKFIISLGAISPEYPPAQPKHAAAGPADRA